MPIFSGKQLGPKTRDCFN